MALAGCAKRAPRSLAEPGRAGWGSSCTLMDCLLRGITRFSGIVLSPQLKSVQTQASPFDQASARASSRIEGWEGWGLRVSLQGSLLGGQRRKQRPHLISGMVRTGQPGMVTWRSFPAGSPPSRELVMEDLKMHLPWSASLPTTVTEPEGDVAPVAEPLTTSTLLPPPSC